MFMNRYRRLPEHPPLPGRIKEMVIGVAVDVAILIALLGVRWPSLSLLGA